MITVEVFYGEPFATFYLTAEFYPVKSFENLMVGVKADLCIGTDESLARRTFQMLEMRVFSFGNPGGIPENIPEPFRLILAAGRYVNFITF